MVTNEFFRELALSFPEAMEHPHFEKTSFRAKKKIFVRFSETDKMACLKFREMDQSVFCLYNKAAIYAVPNKWGKQERGF